MSGFLSDVKVLELGDEKGEFCGKLLAGAGADVIKVEPPGGAATRGFGPFYQDQPAPERSLYFWHYNHGKRGVTLDIHSARGQELLRGLIAKSTVLLDSLPLDTLARMGLDWPALQALNPGLIYVMITPFGRSGPWRDYKANDLVHLALGGVAMHCGYDPSDAKTYTYDTPPIAPQMWQAYHITGNQTCIAVLGALVGREMTGRGDFIDVPVHQAVSVCTEIDIPYWVYQQRALHRQTGRHAQTSVDIQTQFPTKDGRYICAFHNPFPGGYESMVEFLREMGEADDLGSDKYKDPQSRRGEAFNAHYAEVMARCFRAHGMEETWLAAQRQGVPAAAVRKPEENMADPQWRGRRTFATVEHPELGRSFEYIGAPNLSEQCEWRTAPRAPLIGEHNREIYSELLGLGANEIEQLRAQGVL